MKTIQILILLICGTALTQNVTEILVEFSDPVLSDNEKKTCTAFRSGIQISFTITNKENITEEFEIPEGEIKLINKNNVAKEIQTTCTLDSTGLKCIPIIRTTIENGVYYVKLSEIYNIFNTSIIILNNTLDDPKDLIYVNGAYKKIINTTVYENNTIDFKDSMSFIYDVTYEEKIKITDIPDFYAYKDGKLVDELSRGYFIDTISVDLDINVFFVKDKDPVDYDIYSSTPCGNIEFIKRITVKNTGKPVIVFRSVNFMIQDGEDSCTNFKRHSTFVVEAENAYYLKEYQGFSKLIVSHQSNEGIDVITTNCNRNPYIDTPGSDYNLECSTNDYPSNDGLYYVVLKENQEAASSRMHKFVSKQFLQINAKHAKLITTKLMSITHDYAKRDRGDIILEFESKPYQEVKVYLNENKLVCDPKLNSTLICYFTEKDAPADDNGEKKTYSVVIINICNSVEATIELTVNKTSAAQKTQIFLKDPLFPERKCNGYEKDLSFDVPFTVKYPPLSPITYSNMDAIFYLEDSEFNYWFNVTCYHKGDVYNCKTTSDYLPNNLTGLYRFRIEEYNTSNYLVYSMSSTNSLNFFPYQYSEPVSDHFETKHNFKSSEYGTLKIDFKKNLKDRPIVTVNEELLYCYNEGTTTMSCKYDRKAVPPKKNSNKYVKYTGTLIDVCGNKDADITFMVNDFKGTSKSTIIGAVLGTIIVIIVFIILFIVIHYKRKTNDLQKKINELF